MWSKATYVVSMGMLGAGIGYFVTLSRSPVVAVLLPLLFSLVAGAGGVFLTRQDLTQKAGRERLAMLGACIVALVGAAILSSVGVFFIRDSTVKSELSAIPGYKTLEPNEQINLVEMRTVATLLGATHQEIAQILSTATQKKPKAKLASPDTVISKLQAIQPILVTATQQLSDDFINNNGDNDAKERLTKTRAIIQASAYLFHSWASKKLADTSYSIISKQMTQLESALDAAIGDKNWLSKTFYILSKKPSALEALLHLKAAIQLKNLNLVASNDIDMSRELPQMQGSRRIELLKILAHLPVPDRPGAEILQLANGPRGANG